MCSLMYLLHILLSYAPLHPLQVTFNTEMSDVFFLPTLVLGKLTSFNVRTRTRTRQQTDPVFRIACLTSYPSTFA